MLVDLIVIFSKIEERTLLDKKIVFIFSEPYLRTLIVAFKTNKMCIKIIVVCCMKVITDVFQ